MSLVSSISNGISKAGNFVKKLGTRWFRGWVATATASAISAVFWNPVPGLWYAWSALAAKWVVATWAGHIVETLGNKWK